MRNYSFSQYENMVRPESELYKYVEETINASNLQQRSKKASKSKFESTTRFLGHLLQYLGEIDNGHVLIYNIYAYLQLIFKVLL